MLISNQKLFIEYLRITSGKIYVYQSLNSLYKPIIWTNESCGQTTEENSRALVSIYCSSVQKSQRQNVLPSQRKSPSSTISWILEGERIQETSMLPITACLWGRIGIPIYPTFIAHEQNPCKPFNLRFIKWHHCIPPIFYSSARACWPHLAFGLPTPGSFLQDQISRSGLNARNTVHLFNSEFFFLNQNTQAKKSFFETFCVFRFVFISESSAVNFVSDF